MVNNNNNNNCNVQWDHKSLVNELARGRELARQLQIHLNVPSSSHATRELLLQKIILSFEKALSTLINSTSSATVGGDYQQPAALASIRPVESPPHSLNGSPRSEDSDREFREDSSRKRKSVPRWTKQMRVTSGMGLEGPLDDGYSWRKYGQKDILGAKYPRGYYRCTHRNVQGCLATKQVQRSDEDPTIFEITYRGRHTCTQASGTTSPPPPTSSLPERPEPQTAAFGSRQQTQHTLVNIPQGLRVITEGLVPGDEMLPSSLINNNFVGSFSPPFLVGTAPSAHNYLAMSTVSGFGGGNQNFQGGESDQIAETISVATSATNSPTVDFGFPFGQEDHQLFPNFTFDDPRFYS